jgi:hypothetical protein
MYWPYLVGLILLLACTAKGVEDTKQDKKDKNVISTTGISSKVANISYTTTAAHSVAALANTSIIPTQANSNSKIAEVNNGFATSLAQAKNAVTSGETSPVAAKPSSGYPVYSAPPTGASSSLPQANPSYQKQTYSGELIGQTQPISSYPTWPHVGAPYAARERANYAAPQASTGYAAGPLASYAEESNEIPHGYPSGTGGGHSYDYSRQSAAAAGGESYGDSYDGVATYAAETYAGDQYGGEQSYAGEAYGGGDAYGGGETYGGEAYGGGVTEAPPAEDDHLEDFLRLLALIVVAILAILNGFLVFPWIISLLGLATGLVPLGLTLFGPLINFFLGLGGLTLCTRGPPLTVFPGTLTASIGRSLVPTSPLEALSSPIEALFSSQAMEEMVSLIGDMTTTVSNVFLPYRLS